MNQTNQTKTYLFKRIGLIFLSFFILISITSAFADEVPGPLTDGEKSLVSQINALFRRAADQVSPAVVSLQVSKEGRGFSPFEMGLGSGCIIDPRGYIITNNHVVADTDKIQVFLADGRSFVAQEKMFDADTDLAVVKIDPQGEPLPVAKFGNSGDLRVGDFVLAIGNPFGLEQTVTAGIVSFRGRQTRILGKWGYEDFIQTDAAINKGNSGGPLVNLYGEVVGINSNILSPTGTSAGYGFAVPSQIAIFVAEQLIEKKQVRRGWLGVRMIGLDDARQIPQDRRDLVLEKTSSQVIQMLPHDTQGVLATEVLANSPAEQGGIKNNDVILKINNEKITSSKQLQDLIAHLEPQIVIDCLVWRDAKELTLKVKLGDRQAVQAQEKAEEEKMARRSLDQFRDEWPFWPWQQNQETQPEKPYSLGIEVRTLTPPSALEYGYDANTEGVIIHTVKPGSIAEQAGLEFGDIIVSANGQEIKTVAQLKKIIDQADLNHQGLEMVVRNLKGRRSCILKHGPD